MSTPNGAHDAVGDCSSDFTPAAFARQWQDFQARYPAYATTAPLDELRRTQYGRLDRLGHVYLDYTGGGLYAESQVQAHHALLADNVFGNPHSQNPTSLAMTRRVEAARHAVLDFFHADPAEYTVVFTPNASGALKLVGESFPFQPGSRYLLAYDNHNSVNGIRAFARARGASVTYLPVEPAELRLDPERVRAELDQIDRSRANLFAYPAQSNFSGVQHPLDWVEQAQARGWRVLLDCAAFAPTNRLDLRAVQPDFVPLSFYKLFGYPTGVGALIARRAALAELVRPWFAGGTITIASVQDPAWHYLIPGEAGFEDGTVNYLNLPAVAIGLEHLNAVGLDVIHTRVLTLTGWLLDAMRSLRHANDAPLVRIFGPQTTDRRGGAIAFYLVDPAGEPLDVRRVEALAGERLISLRTGCFCNPGDGEVAHNLGHAEMAQCFVGPHPLSFSQFFEIIHSHTGKTPSTMRVSLGIVSNFADVYALLGFLADFRNLPAAELPGLAAAHAHAPDTA